MTPTKYTAYSVLSEVQLFDANTGGTVDGDGTDVYLASDVDRLLEALETSERERDDARALNSLRVQERELAYGKLNHIRGAMGLPVAIAGGLADDILKAMWDWRRQLETILCSMRYPVRRPVGPNETVGEDGYYFLWNTTCGDLRFCGLFKKDHDEAWTSHGYKVDAVAGPVRLEDFKDQADEENDLRVQLAFREYEGRRAECDEGRSFYNAEALLLKEKLDALKERGAAVESAPALEKAQCPCGEAASEDPVVGRTGLCIECWTHTQLRF